MSDPIIRVKGLTKRFGDFVAVDHVDFAVERGSIFAFLGANGSGKSTTIRMLIGLLAPTEGEVEVDGIDVIRQPRKVRDHIGYMGQKVSLYRGLSLAENVEFYAGLYGLAGKELADRWGALAERFALREVASERTEDLPAGTRQRAGLALSILHDPRVLFLDEPTAGVDVHNRGLFWELIQEESAAGVTVFVTTHFLEEVEYCDHACFIDAGRMIADAEPDELRRRYAGGVRIEAAIPAGARESAMRLLSENGATVLATERGISAEAARLTPALLGALSRIEQMPSAGEVRVEQPEMTEVFRRLLAEAQSAIGGAVLKGSS